MPRVLPSQSWNSLCDQIERVPGPVAWRWAAARDQGDSWSLVALVVELGTGAAPLWNSFPSVILAIEELTNAEAAQRLREGHLTGAEAQGLTVSLPVPANATPQWIYSSDPWALIESGWPRWVVEAGAGSTSYVEPQQPLLSPDLPFYPSLAAAVAEKVFCVPPGQLRLGQHPPISLRHTDRRGRIAALEVTSEQVALVLEEEEEGGLQGFALRTAWRAVPGAAKWSRGDRALACPGRVELLSEVPAELVVVLVDSQGREVDRRSWDERFDTSPQDPESLEALVMRWLGEGEHVQLEYKQMLKERKARVSFAETVAAFANGQGGVVLVGVSDEGVAVGYGAPKAADQVTNMIAELVEEQPDFDVAEVAVEGKPIIVVRVAPSPLYRRPHQVGGRIMVRAFATTRRATPAQVRMLTGGE